MVIADGTLLYLHIEAPVLHCKMKTKRLIINLLTRHVPPMMQSSLNRHLHLFKKPKSRLALVSPTTATVTGVGDGVVRLLTIDAVDDTSVSSVFSVCTEFLVVAVDRRSASMVVAFVPFIFSTLSGCSIGCLSSRNDSDKICN